MLRFNMERLEWLKGLLASLIEIEMEGAKALGYYDVEQSTLEAEFLALGVFVAGADNDISSEEIELVNYLFDYDLSMSDMATLISSLSAVYDNVITTHEVPGWAIVKGVDKGMGKSDATNAYITTAETMMELFAEIDGNADPQEMAFIKDFIDSLKRDR